VTNEESLKLTTVTAAVIAKKGKFLAACRAKGHLAGYFEFPGGKLEDEETPQKCLQRELQEEFEVNCLVKDFICESIYHYDEKSIRLLAYYVELEDENCHFELNNHCEIRWLEVSELKSVKWAPADIPVVEKLVKQNSNNQSLNKQNVNKQNIEDTNSWYDLNSETYIKETCNFDMKEIADKFIAYIRESTLNNRLAQKNNSHGHKNNNNLHKSIDNDTDKVPTNSADDKLKILDVGCGSGRDSLYFIERGFTVISTDSSKAICKDTSKQTGLKVIHQKAQNIRAKETYDGIWCCASLLHIGKDEIPNTLLILTDALTDNGVLYISFKYGTKERFDNKGRFFNDYTENLFKDELAKVDKLEIIDISKTSGELRGKQQKWLNIFCRKV